MVDPALLWFDIETTGLKDTDQILAVGAVITNPLLEQIWFKEWYIRSSQTLIPMMPERVYQMHTKSGLIAKCFNQGQGAMDAEDVYNELMDMLAAHTKRKKVYLAGSSIHFDRRFIRRDCPPLDDWLHHRMLDVSALRVIVDILNPQPKDTSEVAHTPLADIHKSQMLLEQYIEIIQNTKFNWPTFIL